MKTIKIKNKNGLIFNKRCLTLFLTILFIEVIISNTSGFIRHTFGDFLAVIMLFYFIKSFIKIDDYIIAVGTLLFSFLLELLQLINFLDYMNLSHYKTLNLILGNTFSYSDLIAYTLGIVTVIFTEKFTNKL